MLVLTLFGRASSVHLVIIFMDVLSSLVLYFSYDIVLIAFIVYLRCCSEPITVTFPSLLNGFGNDTKLRLIELLALGSGSWRWQHVSCSLPRLTLWYVRFDVKDDDDG